MCGRFTQKLSSSEFARLFEADDDAEIDGERYNVAPTDPVAVVVLRDGRRTLAEYRWGLVPHWAESVKVAARMINARAETIERSPAFRDAFERMRCLIPADGFYEWRRLPDGRRLPFYITSADGRPFGFAGLRSTWRGGPAARRSDALEPPPVRTASIVTTTPNELVGRLHNRMPVILRPEWFDAWLDPSFGWMPDHKAELRAMLAPAPAEELVMYPVAPLVNSVRNNGPELIVPVAPEAVPLFG